MREDNWVPANEGQEAGVEVRKDGNYIFVRDTAHKDHVLCFTAEEWEFFIQGVKNGEFEGPEFDG